jgi:hypothetical protein
MAPASTATRAGFDYVPPLADMRFVLENIVDLAGLADLPGYEHADPDTVFGVLEESGASSPTSSRPSIAWATPSTASGTTTAA